MLFFASHLTDTPQIKADKNNKLIAADIYDRLCELNKPIFIMGDSAGGNITLNLTKIIKETGRRMLDRVVALSPCVDMSLSNPEALKLEKVDPLDAVYGCNEFDKMWLKGIDPKDPSVSPLYADVSGFPMTLPFAASNDMRGKCSWIYLRNFV